jgi:hypothetical protein
MSNLDMIKNTGAPVGGGNFGATAAMTGMKTRIGFTCLKCAAKYETAREYAMTDTMAKTMAKQGAVSGVSSVLYSLLGRIPIIGSLVSSVASTAMYTAVNAATGNPYEKAKAEAFEEVKGNFIVCSKCGDFGCASCIKGGLCPTCQRG